MFFKKILCGTVGIFLVVSVAFDAQTNRFLLSSDWVFREGPQGSGSTGTLDNAAKALLSESATSGSLFAMQRVRSVPSDWAVHAEQQATLPTWPTGAFWNQKCDNWGTLTTIFDITQAVERLGNLDGWCIVVAGDRKGPRSYQLSSESSSSRLIFLSAERQEELAKFVPFVALTPWNHFARKNVAYLYAIANGAQLVFDFDDDNVLLEAENLTAYTNQNMAAMQKAWHARNLPAGCKAFNNYNAFVAMTDPHIWPRGLPLDDMQKCHVPIWQFDLVSRNKIAMIQSVANHDPDVDALYRLTRPLPVDFKSTEYPVLLPEGTFSPMNAQAALTYREAAWTLFLPTTIHGRVSDIWRSYIAQTLLPHIGYHVAYVGPLVTQYRNAHTYLADLNAKTPLYERASALVEYLSNWECSPLCKSLDEALPRLYQDLYEHAIVEWEDVVLIHEWVQVLRALEYEFPAWTDKPVKQSYQPPRKPWYYEKVAFVGQFNYDSDPALVVHWARRWSPFFRHIQARGGFTMANAQHLASYNISVVVGVSDRGWSSPMANLAGAIRAFLVDTNPELVGVLYAHDDLVFNVTELERQGLGTDIVLAHVGIPHIQGPPTLQFMNDSHTFWVTSHPEQPLNAKNRTQVNIAPWQWWDQCVRQMSRASSPLDSRSSQYRDANGTVGMWGPSVSDFAYIPRSVGNFVADTADWLTYHKVFLECGFPTIFGHMQRKFVDIQIKRVYLCMKNTKGKEEYEPWIRNCFKQQQTYSLYHPMKLSRNVVRWDSAFDLAQS